MNYEEESRKLLPGKKELMKGVDSCCHYREVFTHNLLLGTCQKVLAKQILKVKGLEKSISDVLTQRDMWKTDYAELQAENKKLKEQQLTVDTIEKVFDKHTIIANSDILYRKDLAKGFNDCRDLCRIPYAKQILKVKELQEQLSNWLQLELDYNKRIKELEAKIKENENG